MGFLQYMISCFLGALISVLVGEFTISLGYRINRSHIRKLNQEFQMYQGLSEEASVVADPNTYRVINQEGNEAFGRLFFYKIALSAASLWPIFFALEWLQGRYGPQEPLIPGTYWESNYVVAFLICYIGARILFGRLKKKIPYFRRIGKMLEEDSQA